MNILKKIGINKLTINAVLYCLFVLLTVMDHTLVSISIISLTYELSTYIRIEIIILAICLFLINIKDIRIDYYLICIVLFLAVASFQMFNFDVTLFKECLFQNLATIFMILVPICSRKNGGNQKKKYLEYGEVIIFVTVFVVDLLSVPNLLNMHKEGITYNQNALGLYNAALTLVLLKWLFKEKDKKIMFVWIVLCLISLVIILITTARSSLLAVMGFIGVMILSFVYRKMNDKKMFRNFLIACLILGCLALLGLAAYFKFDINVLKKFLTGRYELWFIGFPEVMEGHWLFGNGAFTITVYGKNVTYFQDYTMALFMFHNFVLDAIYTAGICGIVLLALFVIDVVRKILKRGLLNNVEGICTLAIVIGFVAANLFDVYFLWDDATFNYLLLFLELGILLNMKVSAKEESHENQ